jgi:hypothetical protein
LWGAQWPTLPAVSSFYSNPPDINLEFEIPEIEIDLPTIDFGFLPITIIPGSDFLGWDAVQIPVIDPGSVEWDYFTVTIDNDTVGIQFINKR